MRWSAAYYLDNDSVGLDRTETERVVGNQYNILLRYQQGRKALLASKGATMVDRGKRKSRRPRAGECRSARKSEKSEDAAAAKKSGGKGKS